MRFSSLHKLIITIVAALFIIGILVMFAWFFMQKIDMVRLEIAETNIAIASMENQRKRMGTFTRMIEGRTRDFERIVRYFVDGERPVAFIEALEDLAKKTESTITLTAGSTSGSEDELVFNLKIEGNDENVRTYLQLIELLPYETRVENFNFQLRLSNIFSKITTERVAELNATIRVKTAP